MSKHDWTEQKQIMILDEEKQVFNVLWDMWFKNQNKVNKDSLESFIGYLSIQYDFNPKDFTIYDRHGKLIHRRVPRNTKVTNGSTTDDRNCLT